MLLRHHFVFIYYFLRERLNKHFLEITFHVCSELLLFLVSNKSLAGQYAIQFCSNLRINVCAQLHQSDPQNNIMNPSSLYHIPQSVSLKQIIQKKSFNDWMLSFFRSIHQATSASACHLMLIDFQICLLNKHSFIWSVEWVDLVYTDFFIVRAEDMNCSLCSRRLEHP